MEAVLNEGTFETSFVDLLRLYSASTDHLPNVGCPFVNGALDLLDWISRRRKPLAVA